METAGEQMAQSCREPVRPLTGPDVRMQQGARAARLGKQPFL